MLYAAVLRARLPLFASSTCCNRRSLVFYDVVILLIIILLVSVMMNVGGLSCWLYFASTSVIYVVTGDALFQLPLRLSFCALTIYFNATGCRARVTKVVFCVGRSCCHARSKDFPPLQRCDIIVGEDILNGGYQLPYGILFVGAHMKEHYDTSKYDGSGGMTLWLGFPGASSVVRVPLSF